MKAVDTNVLLRWITRDDEVQSPIADLVMAEPVYVSLTVLQELAWSLGGSHYKLGRQAVATALRLVAETSTVTIQRGDHISWAIERFAAGADIADMIHLVAVRGSDAFVSFEKRLDTLAGPQTPVPIERPV